VKEIGFDPGFIGIDIIALDSAAAGASLRTTCRLLWNNLHTLVIR
jgi:hypothetical protein